MGVPSRFLIEIPPELMIGPRLTAAATTARTSTRTWSSGARATRFGTAIRTGGGAFARGAAARAPRRRASPSGRRATSARGEARSPAAPPSGSLGSPRRAGTTPWRRPPRRRRDRSAAPVRDRRPIIPGERRYRDGDRVRHARWGDGIVVTSKLTRDDEEVTVVFHDPQVGRKTMLASLANLELVG